MVERCGCGSIHLTIGAITLRLVPEAFAALSGILDEANHSLVREYGARHQSATDEVLS